MATSNTYKRREMESIKVRFDFNGMSKSVTLDNTQWGCIVSALEEARKMYELEKSKCAGYDKAAEHAAFWQTHIDEVTALAALLIDTRTKAYQAAIRGKCTQR